MMASQPWGTPLPDPADNVIPLSPAKVWPTLHPDALQGLPGDAVRAIREHTEADDVAILGTFLIEFGNAMGRSPHCLVSGRRHHANEFLVLVGETSSAKGQSRDYPEAIVKRADPEWGSRVKSGIASGEGLIWQIRDPIARPDKKTGEPTIDDSGEPDKRLMLIEEEYASVIKVMSREGSIVSEIARKMWDAAPLGNLTKTSSAHCDEPHGSMLAHITPIEANRTIDDTSMGNGFGNRNLWALVRRARFLPEGGRLPEQTIQELAGRTEAALAFARRRGEIRRSPQAVALWAQLYPELVATQPGLLGSLTARGPAHVLRLSLIYAMLDQSEHIEVRHIMAAVAVWDYSRQSVRYVFGDRLGNPIADRILDALQDGPLTQTDITNLFGRNERAARIHRALSELVEAGMVVSSKHPTLTGNGLGRSITTWRLA